MKKIVSFLICLFVFGTFADAKAPLESYKRYMIVLVHGTGANTLTPHDYKADPDNYEDEDAPRKSAIWDISQDDMSQGNWQGNIGGNLQSRGFLGHVVWYDFYQPWKSPIYDSNREGFEESLSRYLGDRNLKEANGKSDEELKNNKDSKNHKFIINPMSKNFGRTAQSYWLHEFFPKKWKLSNESNESNDLNVLTDSDLVTYKGNNISYLELAQKDWETWYKIRNSTKDVNEEEKPKKYILIAHSMGGLTTRDYITSDFYKGDVDKLITLDSPHEGSGIANYVKYWHQANKNDFAYVGVWLPPLALTAFMIAGPDMLATMLPKWLLISSMSLLYVEYTHSLGSLITDKFLSGYSDEGLKYGIDVMSLKDDEAYGLYNTNDFLSQFNTRNELVDDYNNGYTMPYVRLVSTSGVPTPGGDGFHKGMIYPVVKSFANLFDGLTLHGFRGENGSFPPIAAVCLKGFTGLFLNSLWNDWGSGFVPHWSSVGKNVALFNNSQTDAKRWNVSFDYSSINGDAINLTAVYTATITGEMIFQRLPWENPGLKILRFAGYVAAICLIVKDFIEIFDDTVNFVGFHGGMARRVDNDKASDAPSGRGSDKKLIDELLWEKPSVSIVYNPIDAWDYKKGGYAGFGTTKELFEYKQSENYETYDVKWNGESSAHEFDIDLSKTADGEEEQERAGSVYIAGKYAGSKIKSITLKKKKENQNDADDILTLDISTCIDVWTGKVVGGEWTVPADNKGLLKCKTGWDKSVTATYTMQVEVANEKNKDETDKDENADNKDKKGGFLFDIGREPGRVFIPGELVTAKDNDWDKYITLKNRRPQRIVKDRIPTETEKDKTVADMVDYHRSPLLVVNQLPRIFELEVDDLQPDRMNKISIDFNFGTASITYEAENDPNKYSKLPDGFEDGNKSAGLIDPSQETFKVTIERGGMTKTAFIKNPIDAWGKMIVDLDELEKKFDNMRVQPFLEGRNHLRIYSENRWQMNRVQDMNIFIPGPPPAVTPIYPMADDAFCSDGLKTKIEFEVDLMYGQSSELVESDLEVSYIKGSEIKKIEGFAIDHIGGNSSTKYKVVSNDEQSWPNGDFSIVIVVKPRINGSPANTITYQYYVKSDCVKPTIVFADDQEIYNPSFAQFNVFDQDVEGGTPLNVEDLIIELLPAKESDADENTCDASDDISKRIPLFAEKFSAPGAKVRNLTWKDNDGSAKYPDGRYRLVVSAHDNTINGNESDKKKKLFWETYGENKLPIFGINDFPKSRNLCDKSIDKMTQWAKAEKNIVLDFTPPVIGVPKFSIATNKEGKIVYAGDALKNDLSVSITATDALSGVMKGTLTLTPLDNLGKFDSKDAFSRFEMEPTLMDNGDSELKYTILPAVDPSVKSMIETMQLIPDGVYALELSIMDQAGNYTSEWIVKDDAGNSITKNYSLIVIDETKPVIKNVNPHSNAESGKKHTISFEVSEEKDVGMLVDLDKVKTSVTTTCGDVTLNYKLVDGSGKKKNGYIEYEYETENTIPQGVSGECKALIVAEDANGNKSESDWTIVVDFISPKITSPTSTKKDGISAVVGVSGTIAIYGYADDPSLKTGDDFVMYELSYAPVDAEGNVVGMWKSIGMSVPESQRCANFAYRSCKPVHQSSTNSVLGYWNTNMIPDEEDDENDGLDQTYRIRVVAYDKENSRDAYVDVFVAAEQKEVPTITFDNLPSEMNFETTASYNVDWKTHLSLGQKAGLVRLEIMRLNENGEKTVTVVNRSFENIIPEAYYGEPHGNLGKGAYLWISKDDMGSSKNQYHLKLVAGDKKTEFNVSFYTGSSASLNVQSGSSSDFVIDPNNESVMGTIGTINKTLLANQIFDYVIETDSKEGLFWNLASSTLKYEGSKFGFEYNDGRHGELDVVPFYVEGQSSEEFAFVGSGKVAIGSKLKNETVHLPSIMEGRNFVWDGLIDDVAANVPSGNYRFKVTLEGLEDYQAASDEKIVKVVGKSVSLTNVHAAPEEVDFSSATPEVSLHFNIDQDALVSAYVRAKAGSAPTDLNEYMKLKLDGHDLLLNKQLLAGRLVDYVVNWNGVYGKSSQIFPNGPENDKNCKNDKNCGYEFVVEVYDLDGTLKKTATAGFKMVSEMIEDNSIALNIDGNSTKKVQYGGLEYLVASGMNDAVLEFAPAGTRVVTDVVPVEIGYKGTQSVYAYPYERYSVGVQIHKRSIKFHAVLGYSYVATEEGIFSDDEVNVGGLVYLGQYIFDEGNPNPVTIDYFSDPGRARDDKGGTMSESNMVLYLVPSYRLSETEVRRIVKKNNAIEELNKYSAVTLQWNKMPSSPRAIELSDYFLTNPSGTPANSNSTDVYWDLGCDVGPDALSCVDLEPGQLIPLEGNKGRGNGVADVGEPMRGTTERYNPQKHQAEMKAFAWAWKNTNKANVGWDPSGTAGAWGSTGYRHNLWYFINVIPTPRFWAMSDDASDYGWNNLVNRYLTIDPLNENFLFGPNGVFKDNTAPFLNKNHPQEFLISNHDANVSRSYFIDELSNPSFQQYYYDGSGAHALDNLENDVEMRLHFFKIKPSERPYYPYTFNIGVFINGNPHYGYYPSYAGEYDKVKVQSPRIPLLPLNSKNGPLKIWIALPENTPPVVENGVPWPTSTNNLSELSGRLCGKGVCGDEETDVEVVANAIPLIDNINVKGDYYVPPINVQMGRMGDGSSGYRLDVYLKKNGEFYEPIQGGKDKVDVTNGNSSVTITEARILGVPEGYEWDSENNLRKKGCKEGCVYVAADDPLMSKIDDDGDGRVAEDRKERSEDGSILDPVDNDYDLAINEDPDDAVRVKLEDLFFPFVGGKSQRSYIDRNLSDLLEKKADEQNVVPGNSEAKGWSVLRKVDGAWSDNEIMLTKWEKSNDPKSFERTALFYKDGKKHNDIEFITASDMNNSDATKATVRIAPSKFDGRDRRLLEVKAKMKWTSNDKYEIYASSDKGWVDLTPRQSVRISNQKWGTIAYWDVETSGFHQLLLIRNSGGKKYYKMIPVAVGAKANDNNTVFADALGRSQISTDTKVDFVDVVPLGKGEIPQTIPADAGLGPVVQIYPALTELKSATFNLRFSKDEVSGQGWQNSTIYVVSEGFSPQPLMGVHWRFYRIGNDGDEEVLGANLTSGTWDYAIATGILSISESTNVEKSVQAPLGENVIMDSDGTSVSVTEKETGVYEVDFNVTSAIGE